MELLKQRGVIVNIMLFAVFSDFSLPELTRSLVDLFNLLPCFNMDRLSKNQIQGKEHSILFAVGKEVSYLEASSCRGRHWRDGPQNRNYFSFRENNY